MSTTKETKTLLVIGNGFDLAHGLKTRYTDFLDFINGKKNEDRERFVNRNAGSFADLAHLPKVEQQRQMNSLKLKRENWEKIYEKNNVKSRGKIRREKLMSHIKRSLESGLFLAPRIFTYIFTFQNIWINYFNFLVGNKAKRIGEAWVDFEKEMEEIVYKIEFFINGEYDTTKLANDSKLCFVFNNNLLIDTETIIKITIPNLEYDLKILSLALELYLQDKENTLVEKATCELIKDLLNVSAVISYNYTNTWQKLYGKDFPGVTPYFIHGKLGEHNLVLGTGETLPPELESSQTECASFKKFFQRVKYRLGNGYHITDSNRETEWQIVIYGHSLDPTDKESLCWLLGEDKNHKINLSKVIVYYYDEKSYNQQIANAIQIIGKEALIENVHSGKLVFEPIPK